MGMPPNFDAVENVISFFQLDSEVPYFLTHLFMWTWTCESSMLFDNFDIKSGFLSGWFHRNGVHAMRSCVFLTWFRITHDHLWPESVDRGEMDIETEHGHPIFQRIHGDVTEVSSTSGWSCQLDQLESASTPSVGLPNNLSDDSCWENSIVALSNEAPHFHPHDATIQPELPASLHLHQELRLPGI